MSTALDEFTQYSYGFNFKLLDVPEIQLSDKESSSDTSNLCVKIFNTMGAHVSLSDIDIAHKVPAWKSLTGKPEPIICKFVRRLAREETMSLHQKIKDVDPKVIGLVAECDFSNAHIVDHLPPKTQELYASMGRKKSIWEGIAIKLQESGYSRSGDQCKTRMHNLQQKYKVKNTEQYLGQGKNFFLL